MIQDSEIFAWPELEVKWKIGKLFMNEKILEEYFVRIYEIDPYFYEHLKEKINIDKNGREYMLFRIDVYFTEYLWAVEVINKTTKAGILFLRREGKKNYKKNLIAYLLELIQVKLKKVMIQTMNLVKYKHLLVNLKIKT